MSQKGVDEGGSILGAALRELYEEVDLNRKHVRLLEIIEDRQANEFPSDVKARLGGSCTRVKSTSGVFFSFWRQMAILNWIYANPCLMLGDGGTYRNT